MSSSTSSRDPYYGYGPISMLSTSIVTTLFPPMVAAPADSYPVTETGKRMPKLVDFIAYALYRTRLNDPIVHSALLLLTRLKQRYPSARGTPSSPHRLFLSALMLASKMSMDDTYSNKSWVIVGQNMFSLSEVNRMERELFGFLNSNCYVTKEDLKSWCDEWCDHAEYDDEEALYQLDLIAHQASPMSSSEPTVAGCDSSDSNSPISCSTTTTSSPSPRTPEEGCEGEVQARNSWKSIDHPVSHLPSSAHAKASTRGQTSISTIQPTKLPTQSKQHFFKLPNLPKQIQRCLTVAPATVPATAPAPAANRAALVTTAMSVTHKGSNRAMEAFMAPFA